MSSTTGANKESNPHDFLVTPDWCVRAILKVLDREGVPESVLDPCSGDGAILRAAKEVFPSARLKGLEIDAERSQKSRDTLPATVEICNQDALSAPSWALNGSGRPKLICTNPPFSLAMPFLERSLKEVDEYGEVAFLLRLAWLSSLDRVAFHKRSPSDVFVLDKRPSFAASLKCKVRKKTGCTYREMLPLTAVRPKTCPLCGAGVDVTTNDSADYAWFVFGSGRGNRWWILEG